MTATQGTTETTAAADSTDAVVGRHLQAFLGGDLDGIMRNFAADALLCTPDGGLRGHGPIRGFFQQVLPLFPPGATTSVTKQRIVDGELCYLVWTASTPVVEVPLGVDVFLVRGGKIAYQCYAGQVSPK